MEKTVIDPSERWPDYSKLVKAEINGFDGQSLAEHVKQLQALERHVLQTFESELAKIDPMNVTAEALKLIDGYNHMLTQIDLAHRNATAYYGSLSQQEKSLFMNNYLPETTDRTLFDKFITKASPSFGSLEEKMLSQLAFQSDVLKLLATPDGYQNLKQLDDFLNAHAKQPCSQIVITLRKGAISQTYFASRARSDADPTAETFVTPKALLVDAPLPQYIESLKGSAPNIQPSTIPKPTRINTGVEVQLHFPYPENLNKAIIKIGRDDITGKPRFIYSPRFVSLHHEFNHTVRMFKGINLEWAKAPPSFNFVYKNIEEFAVIQVENALREHLGLASRMTHSGITYDATNQEALQKFRDASIDMYFRALIEIGVIPESAIAMDAQQLKDLKVEQKLELIAKFSVIPQEHLSSQSQTTEHSSWTGVKPNTKFEEIKEESLLLTHPLSPLIAAKLLDTSQLTSLTDQQIKNLSNKVMQDALLLGELKIDFVKQLSDDQVGRITKAEGTSRNDVILEVVQEVSRKETGVQSVSTTDPDPLVSSEKDAPKIQFGTSLNK